MLLITLGMWVLLKDPNYLNRLFNIGGSEKNFATIKNQDDEFLMGYIEDVFYDVEATWQKQFQQRNLYYRPSALKILTNGQAINCITQEIRNGYFYCNPEETLFIDLEFFKELLARNDISGEFVMAYIIAHEIGHHVQKVVNVTSQVVGSMGTTSNQRYEDLILKFELQAEFYAGIWLHHSVRIQELLSEVDLQQHFEYVHGLNDWHIHLEIQGFIDSRSVTENDLNRHQRWFNLGLTSGDLEQSDTFSAEIR